MIRNILVPTDFSAASRDALNCARELAAALGARLHVLHVVEQTVAPNVYTELYVPPPSESSRVSKRRRCATRAWCRPTTRFRSESLSRWSLGRPHASRTEDRSGVMATHAAGVARLVLGASRSESAPAR